MQVDTPLSLYTLVLGWTVYNAIWDILTNVGIAFLPFLGVFFRSFFLDRGEGHALEDNPRQALVRVEAQTLLMLLAVGFCAAPSPYLALTPGLLSYAPTSAGPLPAANPADTYGASGFGGAISGDIPVPVWWFTTIAISEGLNRAVLDILPQLQGYQEIEQAARLTFVQDPAVRTDVSRFFTDCYVPARSMFMRDNPPGIAPEDVNWVGGEYLLATYYSQLRARGTVQGFPYDPTRDTEFTAAPPDGWGRPYCDDWWRGDTTVLVGLRDALLTEVNNSGVGLTGMLVGALPAGLTSQAIEDAAIRAMLSRDPPNLIDTSLYDQRKTAAGALTDILRNEFVTWALMFVRFFMDLATDITVLGLPVMQSIILMFVYALLPFGIVFSSYDWSFMISGSIFIFSIYFWIPIWHLVEWVREQLLVSLYQGMTTPDQMLDALLMLVGTSLSDATKGLIIDLACTTMYFVAPALFSYLLTMAGIKAGNMVSNALTQGVIKGLPSEAAQGSARLAQGATRNVTRL